MRSALRLARVWSGSTASPASFTTRSVSFEAFRISLVLSQGELIRHPKFGDGVVARVIDRGKVEILFKDGPRTMAHGQP